MKGFLYVAKEFLSVVKEFLCVVKECWFREVIFLCGEWIHLFDNWIAHHGQEIKLSHVGAFQDGSTSA